MARILVVEDDPPVRALLRAILSVSGHRVSEAGNGEDALKAIGDQPFDLVLLDLMLPGMSGYDLLERVKNLPGGHDLKVVVVSALDLHDGRGLKEARLGALDHVTKPFGFRDIETAVRDALSHDAERRQRARYGRSTATPRTRSMSAPVMLPSRTSTGAPFARSTIVDPVSAGEGPPSR